jgi:hypothetical protein
LALLIGLGHGQSGQPGLSCLMFSGKLHQPGLILANGLLQFRHPPPQPGFLLGLIVPLLLQKGVPLLGSIYLTLGRAQGG